MVGIKDTSLHLLLTIFDFLSQIKPDYMNDRLKTIRDDQKETWNRVAYSWKKWDAFTMDFLRPMGDAIIKALDVKSNDITLDIASGTGEPAFTIAAIAEEGKV